MAREGALPRTRKKEGFSKKENWMAKGISGSRITRMFMNTLEILSKARKTERESKRLNLHLTTAILRMIKRRVRGR
jgi:hypothetical protein